MACTLEAHVHTARKHPAVTSLPLSAVGSGFSSLSGERLFGVDKLSVFQILIQLQSALAKKIAYWLPTIFGRGPCHVSNSEPFN